MGGHHAELVGDLLLVHPGVVHSLRHPAAALLLQLLKILLHLVVNGLLRVVEQGLEAVLRQGELPGGPVVALAVLVDGLQLDAVVQVLALVKVRDLLLPAEQAALFLLFLLFLFLRAGFLLRGGGPPRRRPRRRRRSGPPRPPGRGFRFQAGLFLVRLLLAGLLLVLRDGSRLGLRRPAAPPRAGRGQVPAGPPASGAARPKYPPV